MFELPATAQRNALVALIAFHITLIIASNYLVQLPITLWGWHTTWGAFSFPFIFLATDLTVRLIGKPAARIVIARVMLPALVASYIVSVLFHDGAFRLGELGHLQHLCVPHFIGQLYGLCAGAAARYSGV